MSEISYATAARAAGLEPQLAKVLRHRARRRGIDLGEGLPGAVRLAVVQLLVVAGFSQRASVVMAASVSDKMIQEAGDRGLIVIFARDGVTRATSCGEVAVEYARQGGTIVNLSQICHDVRHRLGN